MAEDTSGAPKDYQPSQQSVHKRRREGEVWQSRELTSLATLVAGLLLICRGSQGLFESMSGLTVRMIRISVDENTAAAQSGSIAFHEISSALAAVVPSLLLITLMAALVSFFQAGPVLALSRLSLNFSRLNPAGDGLKGMFGKESLTRLVVPVAKMILLASVGYRVIRAALPGIVRTGDRTPQQLPGIISHLLGSLLSPMIAVLAVFALIDVFVQRRRYLKQIMISYEEMKRQYKDSEGDPHVRARQRAAYLTLLDARMFADAETGHIAVDNLPESFAILRFEPKKESAPRLVARGQGPVAGRLQKIARKKGLYIERNRLLARALMNVKLRTEVPEVLYIAAAEVLQWAEHEYRSRGETAPWESALQAVSESE